MQARIGQDFVRTLKRENKEIRDTKLTGFAIRCRASGHHSYLVQLGRGRWMTIGKVGTLEPHEARKIAHDALVAMASGGDPLAEKRTETPTWGQYLDKEFGSWVREHRKTGAEIVARLTAQFSEWNDTPLPELSGFAVERWRTKRLKSGVTPATVNRDLSSLRGALSRAKAWGLLKIHPMENVKASPVDTIGHVRYLTNEEDAQLMAALTARDDRRRAERERSNEWRRAREYAEWATFGTYTDHLTPLVLTALHTGCRRGELFALRWQDVDLMGAWLTVRAASAKSGLSRVIPLNTTIAEALQKCRPANVRPTALVFPGPDGKNLDNIQTSWERVLKAAKITGFRFHDCRHTFASRLVQAGVDLNTVRELLGHSDIKMTLRYAHLAPEHKAAAVAKLVRA